MIFFSIVCGSAVFYFHRQVWVLRVACSLMVDGYMPLWGLTLYTHPKKTSRRQRMLMLLLCFMWHSCNPCHKQICQFVDWNGLLLDRLWQRKIFIPSPGAYIKSRLFTDGGGVWNCEVWQCRGSQEKPSKRWFNTDLEGRILLLVHNFYCAIGGFQFLSIYLNVERL